MNFNDSCVPGWELKKAFEGYDFGYADPRDLLMVCVLRRAADLECDEEIMRIMRELKLVGKNGDVLVRGKLLLRETRLVCREG